MRQLSIPVLLLALAVVLAACGGSNQEDRLQQSQTQQEEPGQPPQDIVISTLEELLELTNAAHRAVGKPQVDLMELVQDLDGDVYNYYGYGQPLTEFELDTPLTLEQALSDLDLFQSWLRELYLPYYYFGGDKVFDPVFDDIREMYRGKSEGEELTAEDVFGPIYTMAQDYIHDFHFRVNYYMHTPPALPYVYGEERFVKTDSGFRTAGTGDLVQGCREYGDVEELFKLFIDDDGALVWRPARLSSDEEPGKITLVLDSGEVEYAPKQLEWKQIEIEDYAEIRDQDGIPMLVSRNMGFDQSPQQTGKEFLDALEVVGDAPILISDLRGNGGGNTIMPLKWLDQYTGTRVPTNSLGITSLGEYEMDPQSQYYVPLEEDVEYSQRKPLTDKYSSYYDEEDYFVENDRLHIVLTSKNTASAAEMFVDAAHNVENTLFVGTHTAGMLTSNSLITLYLPESGVPISLGSDLYMYEEGYFADYIGFEPDLWVDGDAAELVVKMLDRFEQ